MPSRISSFCFRAGAGVIIAGFVFSVSLRAQSPSPAWPFPSRSPVTAGGPTPAPPSRRSTPPPYDVPLRQERWEQLPNQEIRPAGEQALARVIAGAPPTEALVEIYGNEFSDMAEFEKRFSRFTR